MESNACHSVHKTTIVLIENMSLTRAAHHVNARLSPYTQRVQWLRLRGHLSQSGGKQYVHHVDAKRSQKQAPRFGDRAKTSGEQETVELRDLEVAVWRNDNCG